VVQLPSYRTRCKWHVGYQQSGSCHPMWH